MTSVSKPFSNLESFYVEDESLTPQQFLAASDQPNVCLADLVGIADKHYKFSGDPAWIVPWALVLWRMKDYSTALNVLEKESKLLSSSVDYLTLRGMVLRRIPNRQLEALSAYKKALLLQPLRADIYFNLGNVYRDELQCFLQSERAYCLSLQIDPQSPKAWLNYAISLQELGRLDSSMFAHARGLCLDPSNSDAWNNAGLCALSAGEMNQALRYFLYSLSLDSRSSAAHVNVSNVFVELLSPEQAVIHLERAIALEGGASASANALWNMSLVRLMMGEYLEGWSLYEARFGTKQFELASFPSSGPRVLSLSEISDSHQEHGRQILVWSEQGVGDTIQFCRYLLMLRHLNISFEFKTRGSLVVLMREWLGLSDIVIADKSHDSTKEERPHIPLMSLPHLFATELHTVPVLPGYLKAPSSPPMAFSVSPPPGGISIGLAWASNPDNKAMYRNKSIPLELLMPRLADLMNLDLVEVHSLQVGSDSDQLTPWLHHPRLIDWNGRLSDFSETAHVVQQLDLVISVDTAVAHLAGALNRPTWLLLPANADFRWLRDRSDSPWYPSMRIFRQQARNDWMSVVDQVNDALNHLFLLDLGALVASRSSAQLSIVN